MRTLVLTARRASPYLLGAILTVAGVAHLVAPDAFVEIVPRALPWRRGLVYASGVAELACAVALAGPRTRRAGGVMTAGLLLVVFPANIQMAIDRGGVWWLRLPLQVPLVVWAVMIARRSRRGA